MLCALFFHCLTCKIIVFVFLQNNNIIINIAKLLKMEIQSTGNLILYLLYVFKCILTSDLNLHEYLLWWQHDKEWTQFVFRFDVQIRPDSAFNCKTPFKRERVDLCRVEPRLRKNIGFSDIPCVRLCVIHSSWPVDFFFFSNEKCAPNSHSWLTVETLWKGNKSLLLGLLIIVTDVR